MSRRGKANKRIRRLSKDKARLEVRAPKGKVDHDHAVSLLRARRRMEEDNNPPFLLMGLLELAVPMWIEQVRALPDPVRDRRRQRCLELIAYEKAGPEDSTDRADIAGLATGSTASRPGLIAAGFNALAEALAHLSFCPGGVTWCGSHWDAKQHEARRRAQSDLDYARVDLIHLLRDRAVALQQVGVGGTQGAGNGLTQMATQQSARAGNRGRRIPNGDAREGYPEGTPPRPVARAQTSVPAGPAPEDRATALPRGPSPYGLAGCKSPSERDRP